jgi:hypothetical protein
MRGCDGDPREVRRAAAVEAAERRRLVGADQRLPPRCDPTGGQSVAERGGEAVEGFGNPAHTSGDPLPVVGRLARAEVERHPDERQRAVEVGQLTPRGACLVALELRVEAVAHDRRGDAIGVILDGGMVERAERPAVEVDARLDAVRGVVGHLVVVSR